MKKILIPVIFLLSHYTANAQVQVGGNELINTLGAGKIKKSEFEEFKKSTTLFTLQFKNYDEQALFEKAIKKVWTVTPYKIISPEDIGKYQSANYSFFTFGSSSISKQNGTNLSIYLTYDLWLPHPKKVNGVRRLLAKIHLHPDAAGIIETSKNHNLYSNKYRDFVTNYMYNEASLHNWSPGLLVGYLKEVNDLLAAEETKKAVNEVANKPLLQTLQNDTLYVPEYVNIKRNIVSLQETVTEDADDKAAEAYPYPIRFVSMATLNDLILNQEKPIKYLVYIKSAGYSWVNVYESGEGRLIYSEFENMSFNFKNKYLKKIAKYIK